MAPQCGAMSLFAWRFTRAGDYLLLFCGWTPISNVVKWRETSRRTSNQRRGWQKAYLVCMSSAGAALEFFKLFCIRNPIFSGLCKYTLFVKIIGTVYLIHLILCANPVTLEMWKFSIRYLYLLTYIKLVLSQKNERIIDRNRSFDNEFPWEFFNFERVWLVVAIGFKVYILFQCQDR